MTICIQVRAAEWPSSKICFAAKFDSLNDDHIGTDAEFFPSNIPQNPQRCASVPSTVCYFSMEGCIVLVASHEVEEDST